MGLGWARWFIRIEKSIMKTFSARFMNEGQTNKSVHSRCVAAVKKMWPILFP